MLPLHRLHYPALVAYRDRLLNVSITQHLSHSGFYALIAWASSKSHEPPPLSPPPNSLCLITPSKPLILLKDPLSLLFNLHNLCKLIAFISAGNSVCSRSKWHHAVLGSHLQTSVWAAVHSRWHQTLQIRSSSQTSKEQPLLDGVILHCGTTEQKWKVTMNHYSGLLCSWLQKHSCWRTVLQPSKSLLQQEFQLHFLGGPWWQFFHHFLETCPLLYKEKKFYCLCIQYLLSFQVKHVDFSCRYHSQLLQFLFSSTVTWCYTRAADYRWETVPSRIQAPASYTKPRQS